MTKPQKDNLFVLVRSLTKSEKRQFKLYIGRLGVNEDSKFLLLFKVLEKLKVYDERAILKEGFVKKQQLSNLKAHLYKQILISLRLNPSHQNLRIQLREQLDFATILYHKGLYKQSLKILDKAKSLAITNQEKNIAYEIVELEKVVESQYITRSLSSRADELTLQAKSLSSQNLIASKLSNLSLQLYGLFLKTGYVKSDAEYQKVKDYFNKRLPEFVVSELGFREKLWLYKSYLWYSFLVQDFKSCYRYSRKWVDLFHDNESMIRLNPVFFLRGYQYLLEALFFIKHHHKFQETLKKLEEIINKSWFPRDENIDGLRKGTLYLQKMEDTLLVSVDSVEIKGEDSFTLADDIQSPEFYFLSLNKNDSDSLTERIPFFGEAGEIKINTLLRTFASSAKIEGSQNQILWDEYISIMRKFNKKNLENYETFIGADENKSVEEMEFLFEDFISNRYNQ